MTDVKPIVFVVDDDPSVRESLGLLVESAGWQPETFGSGREFLSRPRVVAPSCLVLDMVLPDFNGCDLQALLADRADMPIIFVSGQGDVATAVRAMKAGAVEFFTKPFADDAILGAIRNAIHRSCAALADAAETQCAARQLRLAEPAGAGGDGARRLRPTEQAGGRRPRHQRDHGEGPPRQDDAQDERRLDLRPGEDGLEAQPRPSHPHHRLKSLRPQGGSESGRGRKQVSRRQLCQGVPVGHGRCPMRSHPQEPTCELPVPATPRRPTTGQEPAETDPSRAAQARLRRLSPPGRRRASRTSATSRPTAVPARRAT